MAQILSKYIDYRDLDVTIQAMAREHRQALVGAMREAARETAKELQRRMRRMKYKGEMGGRSASDPDSMANRWRVRNVTYGAILYNDSPHALAVERGVPAGQIPDPLIYGDDKHGGYKPLPPILAWKMQVEKATRGGSGYRKAYGGAIRAQMAMHNKGIVGQHILKGAEAYAKAAAEEALARNIRKLINAQIWVR